MSPEISAQVVFRTADGRSLSDVGAITSATIGALEPDPQAVERVRSFFRDRGFDVGDLVGLSFSITGSPSLFESVFGDTPREEGLSITASSGALELPMGPLPADVAAPVDAVTFTRPPDFGPTGYS